MNPSMRVWSRFFLAGLLAMPFGCETYESADPPGGRDRTLPAEPSAERSEVEAQEEALRRLSRPHHEEPEGSKESSVSLEADRSSAAGDAPRRRAQRAETEALHDSDRIQYYGSDGPQAAPRAAAPRAGDDSHASGAPGSRLMPAPRRPLSSKKSKPRSTTARRAAPAAPKMRSARRAAPAAPKMRSARAAPSPVRPSTKAHAPSAASRSAAAPGARSPVVREQARARAREFARARTLDRARRNPDRAALAPRHDGDDRFSELRIFDQSTVPEMTFHDYGVNPTISTAEEPVSTFSVDVDSASYAVVRSYLQGGSMPAEAAVRVEEMINAFDYAYAAPKSEPFLVQAEAFPSPNRKGYHVLHLGMKGRELAVQDRKPAALVFVIDVSGSMRGDARLGLVKRSLTMLTRQLDGRDSVGIVVYGSDARSVLRPTRTTQAGKRTVSEAIASLSTEGSTNVEAGLALGYEIAGEAAGTGRTTRVILCSDGMANTGATEAEAILARVRTEAERGVTISTVGFGMGHYNDVLMERLADKGNGNYAYVDTIEAAQRVFVEQLGATLEVIAKDVKLQVAFDPEWVDRYRLVGFENRMLDKRDFSNDQVDAGEIGAGHTVTAIYEIKLKPVSAGVPLGQLRVRYKDPAGTESRLLAKAMPASIVRATYAEASAPTKLSMVVAAFAEKLRGSYWSRNQPYADILRLWDQIPESLRLRQDVAELRALIVKADTLDNRGDRFEALLPVAKMDFDRVPVLY